MKKFIFIIAFVLIGLTKCDVDVNPQYQPPPPGECDLGDKCKDIFCPLFVCRYEEDTTACTCCPTCLKGPGEPCGGRSNKKGKCIDSHICVNEALQEIPESYDVHTPYGTCRSKYCPDCALVDCAQEETLKCEKGTIKDPFCGCCFACLKGFEEECGGEASSNGACPKDQGLACEDEQWNDIFPQENGTKIGTCRNIDGIILPAEGSDVPKPDKCFDCALALCAKPECTYGSQVDPICGCCPVCKKGPGESCGGDKEVSCGDGLVCKDSICVEVVVGGGENTEINPATLVTYVLNLPENEEYGVDEQCPDCAVIICGIPKCDFGMETDPVCGCCPVCKKGPGEPCGGEGNKNGSCGDGLICDADSICVEEKMIEPGCLDCRLVRVKCRSPESLGCPNNFVISECNCCPECTYN